MNLRLTHILLMIMVMFLSACSGASQATQTAVSIISQRITPSPQAIEITPTRTATPTMSQPTAVMVPTGTPDNDPAYYFGGMEISLDNTGQTIQLKKGQNFLLNLGENYRWNVTVQPSEILSRNMKITPGIGEQGLFIARAKGTATLRAVGLPICRMAQPPCNRPDVLFQIQVLIE